MILFAIVKDYIGFWVKIDSRRKEWTLGDQLEGCGSVQVKVVVARCRMIVVEIDKSEKCKKE